MKSDSATDDTGTRGDARPTDGARSIIADDGRDDDLEDAFASNRS